MDAQGINLDASFSVKSVGNCTYLYAPAQGEKRKRLLAGAELAARETANRIAAREHVRAEHRNPLGIVLSKFTEKDEKPRSTSEFFALPTCISCGQCADLCPTNTITIIEGAPRWAELGCTQCLACLHRCPVNAIQYGAKTPQPSGASSVVERISSRSSAFRSGVNARCPLLRSSSEGKAFGSSSLSMTATMTRSFRFIEHRCAIPYYVNDGS